MHLHGSASALPQLTVVILPYVWSHLRRAARTRPRNGIGRVTGARSQQAPDPGSLVSGCAEANRMLVCAVTSMAAGSAQRKLELTKRNNPKKVGALEFVSGGKLLER